MPRIGLCVVLILASSLAAEERWRRHTIDDSSRGADGVRLADVNGDGLPDVVTGWEEGGVIRVCLHPGLKQAATRWPSVAIGSVGSPEDAVFADLDGDGRTDVVSSSEGRTRKMHFHWSPPAGQDYLDASAWKTESVPCAAGQQWMYALPLDFDGRHGIDLIVGSKGAEASIGWLESPKNARDLTAWKYHRLRDAGWIMSLESHDMDGDGDLDVLFSDRKGARRGVYWLENPGAAATGSAWREHAIGGQDQQVMFLARGRIGRREQPAIVCAVSGGGVLLFHPRGTDGWDKEEIPLPAGVGTGKGVAIGDLDGDGDGDLAFTCENAKGPLSGVRWLEFTGDSQQPWQAHEIGGPEGVKFDRIELLDLDGDGDLDLLTCEERDNLGVVWYENVVNSLRELTAPSTSTPSSRTQQKSKPSPAAVNSRSESTTTRPNIIFVLMDDMGYADLGCYGAKDIRTPNIDRLAREGLRFTDFYANAPVCTPTRCGFMTGRWQQRVGFEWAMGYTAEQARRVDGKWVPEPDMHALGLPDREVTIATLLKQAGYATGAFGKWHLGYQPQFNPTRRGFDEYFGTLLGHADYYRYNYFDGTYELRDGDKPVKAEGYLTDLLSRRAAEFIGKHPREPFFLYLPHQAVHAPYQPPGRPEPPVSKAGMNDGDRRAYAAMLEKVDEGIGQMLSELDRLGLADNTLFVLSSDNGGAHFSDNTPLFNGKQTLWEGGIRVPCLMRWPARLPKGKVVDQPAITMDLTATFLAAAGASPAAERPLDGMNLLPILTGEKPPVPRTFYWRIDRSNRQQKAIRHGKWKYVLDGGYVNLLFDLEADPSERRNLAIREPEIMRDLARRLAAWEAEMDASPRDFLVR